MQDPSNDPYLKAADEFFVLSETAATPLMRAYYERVALRYLSSEGQMKEPARHRAPTVREATPPTSLRTGISGTLQA
jgi:hypothetical protein